MLDQIITAAIGLGILGVSFLVNVVSALANVFGEHTNDHFSWKKLFRGIVQALLWALAVLGIVVAINLMSWFTDRLGIDISLFLSGLEVSSVILIVLGGTAGYIIGAKENIEFFIKSKNNKYVEVNKDQIGELNYSAVAEDVKKFAEAITPKHIQEEAPTDKKAEKEAEKEIKEIEIGQGEFVNPLSRRLPDGDNDYGKGWQCSKYSWWLGSGVRMNYAPHPDYGPCNGDKMVDYMINKLGWVRCGKINGAIFSYNSGKYGHTGMVVDASNNMVNDANWTPLKVSTHYLNLEAVGAIYACPKEMLDNPAPAPAPDPTPEPKPQPQRTYTVKKGDSLSKIAAKYYGTGSRWPDIYNANRGVIGSNPNLIKPGQVLVIP